MGEPVDGSFYRDELQPIRENEYRIERILKRRKTPEENEELFVNWLGWSAKYNSWIGWISKLINTMSLSFD